MRSATEVTAAPAAATLSATVVDGPQVFDAIGSEWNVLVAEAMTSTPFQLIEFQRAWWRHLGEGRLLTVVVRDADERLVALAPLNLVGESIAFNGCIEESDYLDLIARVEDAEDAWAAVFDSLLDPGFPPWTDLALCNIPAASPSTTIIPRLAVTLGLSFAPEPGERCPFIPLPASYEAYLAGLDKKQRHEIRRKVRRSEAAGAVVRRITAPGELEEAMTDFFRLLQLSSRDKASWLHEDRQAFFKDLAREALAAGILELLFLEIEGQRAAAAFNFDYQERIWVYNSGLDPTRFGHLSAGIVITAAAIRRAIEAGRAAFDFLRGDETYKYRFGARDTHVHHMRMRREASERGHDS